MCVHRQEEACGTNGVWRHALESEVRREPLPMRVKLIGLQVHAYFEEKISFYLVPEFLFYSRTFFSAR